MIVNAFDVLVIGFLLIVIFLIILIFVNCIGGLGRWAMATYSLLFPLIFFINFIMVICIALGLTMNLCPFATKEVVSLLLFFLLVVMYAAATTQLCSKMLNVNNDSASDCSS